MPELLDKELLVVIGKGGVGKSTVAAALGVAAARAGRRTIVAEVAGRDDVTRTFGGHDGGYGERELAPNLSHISIDPQHALEEYLHEQLPLGLLAGLVGRSEMFLLFTAATPGMRELLSMGKVWQLTRSYDLVILDAPATGHGVAMLTAPQTFAAAARVGPVARQGSEIDALLRAPERTGMVVVATPEEMAVTEALDVRDMLRRELGHGPGRVVVNGVLPRRFTAADAAALEADSGDPAVTSALWLHDRSGAQRPQLGRLRRGLPGVPSTSLPFLFADELSGADVERLAGMLDHSR